jgi:hypothetical protein
MKNLSFPSIDGKVQICNYASDYKEILSLESVYTFKHLSYFEYEEDIKKILNSIYNTLPDWKAAPTLKDIEKRFQAGTSAILQYYKNEICGWAFFCPFYADDYYTKINDLTSGGIYWGSTYVIKSVASRSAGAHLYSYSTGYYLKKYNCMYSWMDDWNVAPIKLCLKCGGKVENWI